MARPRKFYIIFENGRAVAIANGLDEARRHNSGWHPFTTQIAAEEYATWWNHDHPHWWTEGPASLMLDDPPRRAFYNVSTANTRT